MICLSREAEARLSTPWVTTQMSYRSYSWWTIAPYFTVTADRAEDALEALTDYYLRHPERWWPENKAA
jgi:hypothetical protein